MQNGRGEVMEQPCRKDCPKRSATCHATCEDWQKFEAWKFANYAERAATRSAEDAFFDAKERIKLKNYRKKGKWGWG